MLAFVAPAVTPKLNVLVTDIAAVMFDVPVNVKFVASAIDKTVDAAVVVVRTIEPVVPNAITLVLVALEENKPVLSVKLFRFNVPFVSVVVLNAETVMLSCSCQVPPTPLNVTGKFIVLLFVVMVFVPLVAPNVNIFAVPAVIIPVESVKFP